MTIFSIIKVRISFYMGFQATFQFKTKNANSKNNKCILNLLKCLLYNFNFEYLLMINMMMSFN